MRAQCLKNCGVANNEDLDSWPTGCPRFRVRAWGDWMRNKFYDEILAQAYQRRRG
jgi:hypothetical protein